MKNKLSVILFLITATLSAGTDARYDAGLNMPFNQKAGDVNPQTGNVTVNETDLSLPGRSGFNFTFGRTWNLNSSNVYNMDLNPVTGNNRLSSNTPETHHHLGVGWASSIPYIHRDINGTREVVHLFFGGSAFQLDLGNVENNNPGNSNILGYDLLDKRVYSGAWGAEISYGDFNSSLPVRSSDQISERSRYVLILKDNSRYYFREDGTLMMNQDPTGLNRIWYFYNEEDKLTSVIDSVGREIEFNYDSNGNLSELAWSVISWEKDEEGKRYQKTGTRKVQYFYQNAAEFQDVADLKDKVEGYKEPYVLKAIINPVGEKISYSYTPGKASFSFNERYHQDNVYLMLAAVKNNVYDSEDGEKYSAAKFYEYEVPAKGMYNKFFYTGYMEYYKISKIYLHNRHKKVCDETNYTYFNNGENGNYNQYSTLIQMGGVSTTYYYSLKDSPGLYQVLDKIETETTDGFKELKNSVYDNNKTKILDEVYRFGKLIYDEKYQYDKKGNLKRYEDRQGLITLKEYDPVYSKIIKENRIVTYHSEEKNYQKEWILNEEGNVVKSVIFLEDAEGKQRPVTEQIITYDGYGNIKTITDAEGHVQTIEYDRETSSLPVYIWSEVTIDSYKTGDALDNWQKRPDSSSLVETGKRTVFNNNGSVYMEFDTDGNATEHFYDSLGREIETILPDNDDSSEWYLSLKATDDVTKNSAFLPFLASRENNAGTRTFIDDKKSFAKTETDIDLSFNKSLISAIQSDGLGKPEEEYSYDVNGIRGIKRTTYDSLGRMLSITDPDAGSEFTEIVLHGEKVKRYDKTWIVKYDDLGRQVKVLYPVTHESAASVKYMTYNDRNNSVETIDPEGRRTLVFSDWAGNITQIINYGRDDTKEESVRYNYFEYDSLSRKRLFTDALGEKVWYNYNARDLIISLVYGQTGSDTMSYNDKGLLIEKTDRKGNKIETRYDEAGRAVFQSRVYPDGTLDEEIRLSYNRLGLGWRIEGKELTEYSEYNEKGALITHSRYLKNDMLRAQSHSVLPLTENSYTFFYEYNDSGLLTSMSYPDGGIHTFDYDDASGFLNQIGEGENRDSVTPYVYNMVYNKSGVTTSMVWQNGTTQEWEFDNRKRIKKLSIFRKDKILEELNYTLNSVGDIQSINANEYQYNGFGEISGAKTQIPGKVFLGNSIKESFGSFENKNDFIIDVPFLDSADLNKDGRINGADKHLALLSDKEGVFDEESFSYDKAGNRLTLNQNGDIYTYEYGVRNQLKTILKNGVKSIEYEYDNNGNTIKKSVFTNKGNEITEYKYDTLNRLIESSNLKGICNYSYDNAGNRFVKTIDENTTVYLRQGAISVAMDIELTGQTGDSKVNRYVLSGDLIAGKVTTTKVGDVIKIVSFYYHLDHLNSTKLVTDEKAEITVKYEYRAFGDQLKRLDEQGQETEDHGKYSYGGKELDDENGLYYFNARYYDSATGRFINVDPIQDGTNWYIYCNNNPLNMVDPTGLEGDSSSDTVDTPDIKEEDVKTDTGNKDYSYLVQLESEESSGMPSQEELQKGLAKAMTYLEPGLSDEDIAKYSEDYSYFILDIVETYNEEGCIPLYLPKGFLPGNTARITNTDGLALDFNLNDTLGFNLNFTEGLRVNVSPTDNFSYSMSFTDSIKDTTLGLDINFKVNDNLKFNLNTTQKSGGGESLHDNATTSLSFEYSR